MANGGKIFPHRGRGRSKSACECDPISSISALILTLCRFLPINSQFMGGVPTGSKIARVSMPADIPFS